MYMNIQFESNIRQNITNQSTSQKHINYQKPSFQGLSKDVVDFARKPERKSKGIWGALKKLFTSEKEYISRAKAEDFMSDVIKESSDDKINHKSVILNFIQEKKGYSKSVLSDIKEIYNTVPEKDAYEIVNCSHTEYKKFDKNLLSQSVKMLKLGMRSSEVNDIQGAVRFLKCSPELINSLTKDLPKIEDTTLLTSFIKNRNTASAKFNGVRSRYELDNDAFNVFNDIYNANKDMHNEHRLNVLAHSLSNNREILSDYKNDKNFTYYMETLSNICRKVDDCAFEDFTKVVDTGCDKEYLAYQLRFEKYPFNTFVNEELKSMKDFQKKGINSKYLLPVLEFSKDEKQVRAVIDVMEIADKKRSMLSGANNPVTDAHIIDAFAGNQDDFDSVLNILDTVGKDTLVGTFSSGMANVMDFIQSYPFNLNKKYLQPLIKLVNPTSSDEVIALDKNIKENKLKLRSITDDVERKNQIIKINNLSKQKSDIINSSIKNPEDKVSVTKIYLGLIQNEGKHKNDYYYANKIAPFMNPKTEEEKQIYHNKLNNLVWKSLEINRPEQIIDKFDFARSKYLDKMFFVDNDFKTAFSNLITFVSAYPNKSVEVSLNSIHVPQNKETKSAFKKLGLNYENWSTFNPNLKLNIKIKNDYDKQSKNTIRNLESEFNDEIFSTLPEKPKNQLLKRLEDNGFTFNKTREAVYVDDGFYDGTKEKLQLCKDGKPIEFKQLSNVFKLIDEEFTTNDFWKKNSTNSSVNKMKETFKDHISTRHNEMKRVRQVKNSDESDIQIQKVDMNDIVHALFLGNDASCCTAIGSFNDWTAPNYIKNKMVQAIELKDGENSIGNTMMYVAKIDGKPALLLDNIELKPKYQYNDKIEDGIVNFAKMVTKDLGKPDMPIYAGSNRHKLNMKNFELVEKNDFNLVGTTHDDPIYLDFVTEGRNVIPSTCFNETLYKLK